MSLQHNEEFSAKLKNIYITECIHLLNIAIGKQTMHAWLILNSTN